MSLEVPAMRRHSVFYLNSSPSSTLSVLALPARPFRVPHTKSQIGLVDGSCGVDANILHRTLQEAEPDVIIQVKFCGLVPDSWII